MLPAIATVICSYAVVSGTGILVNNTVIANIISRSVLRVSAGGAFPASAGRGNIH